MRNLVFSDSFPAAEFENQNPRQEKKDNEFVLIHFEHTEIDKIRRISESGYYPIAKRTIKMELVALHGVPLS